ncbi:MAG: glycosyltransferase [Clostridiales bacterium]|nr:glycosyltransferase [Clostridiales bacterium]
MNIDILFLSQLLPKEKETEIKRKIKYGMPDAANALQWNIIDGLEANDCGKMKILNYLPVGSYPNSYTDKKIENFVFQHTQKYRADDLNLGCSNLTVIKQLVNPPLFKREIKKWAKQDNGTKKILIIYTAKPMFLTLAKYAKKCNINIDTCCIIADIPEFCTASSLHGIRKIYNDYGAVKCASLYKYIDKFVLLTKQMAHRLAINAPFIVMEGIATKPDTKSDISLYDKFRNEKYILYSGSLNHKFGIGVLIEAFSLIQNQEIKLLLCGFGDAEELIKEKQNSDNGIVFLGKIDRKQVVPLQRGATVLVNPRQNIEEYTKYSFPSKNLEYLSSGVPVVAYKLDGIPDEYDKYLNYPADNSPETLAIVLTSICNMTDSQRIKMGQAAQSFVLKNKNNVAQTKRILEFIKSMP